MNTAKISAKMIGGYFDGKEIQLSVAFEGDLRLPLPSATQQDDDTYALNPFMAAVYRQTKDASRWEYVGVI